MTDHSEIALNHFLNGMTCAQAVLCAFEDVTGLDRDTAMKVAASFGGGLGGRRDVCGALTGALMALGLVKGWTTPGDGEAKKAHYARTQALARGFEEKEGAIACRALLNAAGITPQAQPEARTPEYYARRPCPRLVREAAALLDEALREFRD